jgi:uncharacterized protein (TIGR03067 family)
MTRIAVLGVLVLAAVGVAPADDNGKKDPKAELARFQGTWKVVGGEEGGKPLPPPPEAAGVRFVIEGNKMTVKGPKGKETETSKGSFTIDPSKDPAEIDSKSEEKGEEDLRVPGIYKFDGDRLSMCFTKGLKPNRPKTFATKDTPGAILMVLEKVKE